MTAWSLVKTGRSHGALSQHALEVSSWRGHDARHVAIIKEIEEEPIGMMDLPAELMFCVAMNLSPDDISNLSKTAKRIHRVLLEYRSSLFENLIKRFDPDVVVAYRSTIPSFVSIDRAQSANTPMWGPTVMVACHLRKPTPARSPTRHRLPLRTATTSTSQRDAYYDLKRITSWLEHSHGLVNRTVENFKRFAMRRVEREGNGGVMVASSWIAAATVVEFRRRRLEMEEMGGGKVGIQREKLEEAKRRLRVHAIRMVVLLFAIAIGAKREAREVSRVRPPSPSTSIRSSSPTSPTSSSPQDTSPFNPSPSRIPSHPHNLPPLPTPSLSSPCQPSRFSRSNPSLTGVSSSTSIPTVSQVSALSFNPLTSSSLSVS
ncbi:hypothetical protein BC829DRAFT_255139 [Chytridium lagenaria]|nr:hypothetical protein BC829DRAFT_255139 [Chytridium lagenaria]